MIHRAVHVGDVVGDRVVVLCRIDKRHPRRLHALGIVLDESAGFGVTTSWTVRIGRMDDDGNFTAYWEVDFIRDGVKAGPTRLKPEYAIKYRGDEYVAVQFVGAPDTLGAVTLIPELEIR